MGWEQIEKTSVPVIIQASDSLSVLFPQTPNQQFKSERLKRRQNLDDTGTA